MKDPRHRAREKIVGGTTALVAAILAGLTVLAGSGSAAAAAAPQNSTRPTITGKAQAGQTLTADPGSWHSNSKVDYSYQWRRCGPVGANCVNLPGATDRLYTVRPVDVGRTLRVLVTAVNNDGANTATSKPTEVVTAAPTQAPSNTTPPSIAGTTKQGEVLTANAGTWTGTNPIDFTYRWRLCDDKGGDCTNTSVAGQTYKLGAGDVGKTLRVLVTATNSAGSGAAISNATSVVQGTGTPPPTTTGSSGGSCKSISQVSPPSQLLVDQIQSNPARIADRNQPVVVRFHVVATGGGGCVSGAVVYAVGVPFDRLSKEPETPTAGDGWATITFHILPTFQLKHGNLVVIFVRARKPGDSVLAGVSTRRLVSLRVA
jgi:uncharacterized membrane protein